MPLETASYISDLEPLNPPSTDQLSQADEHLRLIKSTLQATFPNITGPVTSTQDQINDLFVVPVGLITLWYGEAVDVPSGWAICDGGEYSLSIGEGTIHTPDLRDRVVIGAGTVAPYGATAGALTATATTGDAGSHTHTISGGDHTHTGSALGHSLTVAETPTHYHYIAKDTLRYQSLTSEPEMTLAWSNGNSPGEEEYELSSAGVTTANIGRTSTSGSGTAHSHTVAVDSSAHAHSASTEGTHAHSVSVSTVQPCLGLHYIMKV